MRSLPFQPIPNPPQPQPRWFRKGGWRGFLGDRSGASALEFAIVAMPLILLLLGIVEVGLIYAGNYSLENAVNYGARLVRTGQAQDWSAAAFKQQVCAVLMPPISCSGLQLDVRTFDNFSGVTLTNPLDASGNLKSSFAYNPGARDDVVVVRAFYDWPLTALFPKELAMGNMGSGDHLLIATAAFRNEPF